MRVLSGGKVDQYDRKDGWRFSDNDCPFMSSHSLLAIEDSLDKGLEAVGREAAILPSKAASKTSSTWVTGTKVMSL